MIWRRGPNRRSSERGQALGELALLLPILVLISLGVFDIGSASSMRSVAAGGARAGLRVAQQSGGGDVGAVIRMQAQNNIPNSPAAWGTEAVSGANSCGTGSTKCGDPGSCVATSDFWNTVPQPQACFSVAPCTFSGGPPATCPAPAPGSWGVRPAASTNGTVIVRVAVRVSPLTPVVSTLTTGGSFFVTTTVFGTVTY